MSIKGRNRGTYITPKARSQDAEKLPQRYNRGLDQHIIGCYNIEYEEVDEIKEKEILKLIFLLAFPNLYSARQILKPGEVSKNMN